MDETNTTTPTTDSRPVTMTAALEASASAPAETQPSVHGDAATTAPSESQPAQGSVSVPAKAAKEPGPIPYPEHKQILENARKETERVKTEIEKQYQWAKGLDGLRPEERNGLVVLHRAISGDPQARADIARVQPEVAQSFGWVKPPVADPEPEPDFVLPVKDGQGNIVGERPIYSAEQQAKREAWLKRQWMGEVRKEIAPLQKTAHTMEQREATATYTATTGQVISALEAAHPEFKAHKPDVWKVIDADPRLTQLALSPETAEIAIRYAWSEVHRDQVLPAKEKAAEAETLAHLQTRAVAAAGVNPATATTTTPRRPKSMTEALAMQGA